MRGLTVYLGIRPTLNDFHLGAARQQIEINVIQLYEKLPTKNFHKVNFHLEILIKIFTITIQR